MILYPYICKYFKFPVGHPIIHVGCVSKDIEACLRMDGLIKCSIVPTEKFYHPVLPYKCKNKFNFVCGELAFSPTQLRNVCIPEMRIVPSPVRE
jgi:hypothetical protein